MTDRIQRVTNVSKAIDEVLCGMGRGSVKNLSEMCGVAHSTVGSWRRGERLPQPRRWRCIENFLEMKPGTIAELVNLDADEALDDQLDAEGFST